MTYSLTAFMTSSFARKMTAFLGRADLLLRGEWRAGETSSARQALAPLLGVIFAFGCLYGAAMGTYGGVGDGRVLQMLYSAVKVPLLLLVTFILSLPSFFVFNTLSGLGADWPQTLRALLSG